MTLYQIVLFVHAVSVLLLSASLGAEVWMLYILRRSTGHGDLLRSIGLAVRLGILTSVSLLVVQITGAWLTELIASWSFSWPKLAFWGVILVGFLGGLSGRRLRSLRKNATSGSPLPQLLHQLRSPLLKTSLHIRVWLVPAILLLTILKSSLPISTGVLLFAILLGLATSAIALPRSAAPQPQID